MEILNKQLVSKAKREWVNRMKKSYPNFNHKLWGRNNSYRLTHPQQALSS